MVLDASASRSGFILFGALYGPLCLLYVVLLITGKLLINLSLQWYHCCYLFPLIYGFLDSGSEFLKKKLRTATDCGAGTFATATQLRRLKTVWLEYPNYGRVIKMPRLLIHCKEGKKKMIAINSKPFSRDDLKRIREILEGTS